ncbi:hypothetical protein L873DRAFT_1820143 [Choiromyces venosus 120613-1]|uniref:Tim44-like domain-containing protein n=1 Tax=Choiromyces venosus 120613-1 TaxID=1336337 RepID=A0A3N4IYR0_9PEZI|nr:hypothetical protein L873DRAFT_1820143 [Choiromyces venosus 120613-1]
MFHSLTRAPLPPFTLFRSPVNANANANIQVRYKSLGKGLKFAPPPPKPQQSVRLAAQVGQEAADIGLLVDTFIMPTGKNLPSLFTAPRERLQLERRRIRQRLADLRDMLVFRYTTSHPIRAFQARKFGPALHNRMYTAFALGDINTLRSICSDGLLSSFRKRLSVRPSNVRMEWRLLRMLSRPRVVSSKAHHYAGVGLNRRQAVVRLHSLQSLEKVTLGKLGEVLSKEGGEEKEVVEYLVIEKKYDKGVESAWSVWGTTEETTMEKLKKMDEQKRLLGLM